MPARSTLDKSFLPRLMNRCGMERYKWDAESFFSRNRYDCADWLFIDTIPLQKMISEIFCLRFLYLNTGYHNLFQWKVSSVNAIHFRFFNRNELLTRLCSFFICSIPRAMNKDVNVDLWKHILSRPGWRAWLGFCTSRFFRTSPACPLLLVLMGILPICHS